MRSGPCPRQVDLDLNGVAGFGRNHGHIFLTKIGFQQALVVGHRFRFEVGQRTFGAEFLKRLQRMRKTQLTGDVVVDGGGEAGIPRGGGEHLLQKREKLGFVHSFGFHSGLRSENGAGLSPATAKTARPDNRFLAGWYRIGSLRRS
jgi:hypothetical protein